ncbi:hypothetical protein LCGC14_0384140 [marine sediment metagenome]|uniref:HTH cro/C1-type domain-containing protein n=1 Tax=marine sediment metagenome TaxID=412755 RepID=A0A0F9T192_9ZZZZ
MAITQKRLAKAAGVTQGMISKFLNGQRRPRWFRAKKLAAITGTAPELWMEGSPDEIQAAVCRPAHRVICGWCRRIKDVELKRWTDLRLAIPPGGDPPDISHGVCPRCEDDQSSKDPGNNGDRGE